ncbi:MAG: hypothetical protein WBP85_07475 [Terracidiphilus sp.]
MKLVCSVSLVLLLSAGTLAAQGQGKSTTGSVSISPNGNSAQQPSAQTNAVNQSPVYIGCPIAMRAQHMADGQIVKAGNARPQGIGQWLHLTLTAPDAHRIAKAELTIRGSSPKGRMTQTLESGDSTSDASARQVAEFTAGPDRQDLSDLWVPGITAVQSIEIDSVTYADGSTWKLTGSLSCRVIPEAFMLVTSR